MNSELTLPDGEMVEERDFWLKATAGLPPEPLLLRPDHPRPSDGSGATGSMEVEVPAEVYERLKDLTSENPFLLYTCLLAALQVCLYRHSGVRRIFIGSPARRYDLNPYQQDNALPIVYEVDDRLSFKEHLLNVRQVLLDSYARQLYSFERMVGDLGLEGVKDRCPLFDVALALTDIHTRLPQVGNDITFTFSKTPDGLSGNVAFKRELFEAATVRHLAGSFIQSLRSALEDKNRPLRDLQTAPGPSAPPTANGANGKHGARTAGRASEGRPAGGEYVAPRNELERRIANIWLDVLGVERVSVEDNFFDLGGQSLHMAEACTRLQASFGREFSQVEMFKHTTVAALANFLSDQGVEEPSSVRGHDRGGVRRAARGRRQRGAEHKG